MESYRNHINFNKFCVFIASASSYGPFVERPFAKLKYVNLLGTFVGLAFVSKLDLVMSNLKINR